MPHIHHLKYERALHCSIIWEWLKITAQVEEVVFGPDLETLVATSFTLLPTGVATDPLLVVVLLVLL